MDEDEVLLNVKKWPEWIISRILYPVTGAMIIYLGCRSPGTSCNLPGNFGRAALQRSPIWSCSGWGLPCHSCHHESGELLPHHFTLTPASRGGIFSVALSAGHPTFALRTTLPCGVRTFLSAIKRSDHASTPAKILYNDYCLMSQISRH